MALMRVKNKQTEVVSVASIDVANKIATIQIPSVNKGTGGILTSTTFGISWEKFCNEYEILGPVEEDGK